jgi:hypothetical protein
VASESLCSLSYCSIEASNLAIVANTWPFSLSYASVEASNVAIVASMSPCSLSHLSIEASNVAIAASYSSVEASNLAIAARTSPCSLSCWSIEASRDRGNAASWLRAIDSRAVKPSSLPNQPCRHRHKPIGVLDHRRKSPRLGIARRDRNLNRRRCFTCLAAGDRKRPRLVRASHSPRALRRVQRGALRRAHRLIAQMAIAYPSLSHRVEQLHRTPNA